jgi:hypothetical protein
MEDDLDLGLLQEQYKKRFLTNQLASSENPYADLGLQLAGGGIDLLSRHAQGGADITQMLTGIQQPRYEAPGAEKRVRDAIQARETKKRQAALDDMSALASIQKLIDSKKEKDLAAVKGPLELQKLQAEIENMGPEKEFNRMYKMAQLENMRAGIDAKKQKSEQIEDPLRKMSGEQKMKVGMIGDALRSIDQYENAYSGGERRGYINPDTPLIGSFLSASEIDEATTKLSDDIGRLRSGGAINKDEENRFLRMLPTPADDQETAMRKINNIRQEFKNKLAIFGVNEEGLTKAGFNTQAMNKQSASISEQTKVVGGVTYRKVQGGWQRTK